MEQPVAPPCRWIRIITAVVLVLFSALALGAVFFHTLLPAAGVGVVATACCYLWAPIGYRLEGRELTVRLRLGHKRFPGVIACGPLRSRPACSIRLWGNGGLFAATGIFWCRPYGMVRAYVTRVRHVELVLLRTATHKVIISPADPDRFIRWWEEEHGRAQTL